MMLNRGKLRITLAAATMIVAAGMLVRSALPLFPNLTAPSGWEYEMRYPEIKSDEKGALPQGLEFLDSQTLLVTAHYDYDHSYAHVVDLEGGETTGQFIFESEDGETMAPKIGAISTRSDGSTWVSDNTEKTVYEVDIDASIRTGHMVVEHSFDLSALRSTAAILWHSVSGREYLLVGEYASTGEAFLYAISGEVVDGGEPYSSSDHHMRFSSPQRTQGMAYRDGLLYISSNNPYPTDDFTGVIYTADIDALLTSGDDGDALEAINKHPTPSPYPEDLDFHPDTRELWMPTEGLDDYGSHPAWLAIWSSPIKPLAKGHP